MSNNATKNNKVEEVAAPAAPAQVVEAPVVEQAAPEAPAPQVAAPAPIDLSPAEVKAAIALTRKLAESAKLRAAYSAEKIDDATANLRSAALNADVHATLAACTVAGGRQGAASKAAKDAMSSAKAHVMSQADFWVY